MLPNFLFVSHASPSSEAIAKILALMSEEIERHRIGGEIVSSRLADVLLIEAIRAYSSQPGGAEIGWLGALSDPRLGRVLRAIHEDVAQSWTVAAMARVAGMSRAAFAAKFTHRIGQPPLSYLRVWRLTLARAALTSGNTTVAAVSSKVGYTSQSAFGEAFKREFGSSPRASRIS
jgi:AraC-like DNA-binding protein